MKKHINHFKTVFIRLKKYGIVMNLITCTFGTSEVEFLGLRIGGASISPFLTKTKGIIQFPIPTNMKPLRQFLGMVNFYRHFIPNCASILKPLINLLTNIKKCDIVVPTDALSAFSKIKAALTKTIELSHVLPDVELCLAVRLELGQFYNKKFLGLENLFRFFRQKLTNTQKRYSTFGENCMPLMQVFVTLGISWKGRRFYIFTYHKPLVGAYRSNSEKYSPRQVRHLHYLLQFTSDIKHLKGIGNIPADTMSRTINAIFLIHAQTRHNLWRSSLKISTFRSSFETIQLA